MSEVANIIEANRQTTLRNIKLYAPQLVRLINEADENDTNRRIVTDAVTINRTMADDLLAMFTPFETAVREIDQLRAEVERTKDIVALYDAYVAYNEHHDVAIELHDNTSGNILLFPSKYSMKIKEFNTLEEAIKILTKSEEVDHE